MTINQKYKLAYASWISESLNLNIEEAVYLLNFLNGVSIEHADSIYNQFQGV